MLAKDISNPEVASVFASYPTGLRDRTLELRRLILRTAAESDAIGAVTETLKWGEPAYVTPRGSTVRIAWNDRKPDQYAMYFICTTRLVETFRELYRDTLRFDGNRAIVFLENDAVPVRELKHCIQLALTYHNVKHLPLLGA